MGRKKILFICGSLNQTNQMFQISRHLCDNYDCYFTPYYVDSLFLDFLYKKNLLEFTVAGKKLQSKCIKFIEENNLEMDFGGSANFYDLVITSSDLIIQQNIRNKNIILVQEGMTDPENIFYYLSRWVGFPRYLASTSATGLSGVYKAFCVASEGYKELFTRKGIDPSKIHVTGIPNFDNFKQFIENDFPFKNYVLCATSDARETFKYENRKKLIRKVFDVAEGRLIIFKLHPNENFLRAEREIKSLIPESLVFKEGNTNHMVANCDILVTTYSSVVYAGLALGKKVFSNFNIEGLKRLLPIQNGGNSAGNIAELAKRVLQVSRLNEISDEFVCSPEQEERLLLKSTQMCLNEKN